MIRQDEILFDRTPGMACYRQISHVIRQKIDAGEYRPGDQLPTESDLGRLFGVNRLTAREALKLLKNDGTVVGIQGKGNYVAEKRIRYRVSQKVRYSSSIMEAGMLPGTRMIACRTIPADEVLARKLELPEGAELVSLELVRYADGIPFMLSTTYLPADRVPGLREHLNGSFSLYGVLGDVYGIEATRSESVFEVMMPTPLEIRHLAITPELPVLLVSSLSRDQRGAPVEYCMTRMRGDMGSMVVQFG